MIRRLLYCLLLLTALAAVSCSHESSDDPDRPGRPGQPPKEDPELSDDAMRITGSLLNFYYDEGGILFSQTDEGAISAIRLRDGFGCEFDPAGPSFKVNGVSYAVSSAELIGKRDNIRWHRITLADIKTPVYIVVSL